MAEELFKIVFKGEIGLDFEEEEVKQKLQEFCRFDRNRVEQLFSGGTFVLTKNIDQEKASRFQGQFQKIGAMVEVLPMASPPSLPLTAGQKPVSLLTDTGQEAFKCPACGYAQDKGLICVACGISFAKLESMQKRQRDLPAITEPANMPPIPGNLASRPSAASGPPSADQTFLAVCGALILGAAVLQIYFAGMDLMIAGFIILLVVFFLALMFQALSREQGVLDALERQVTLEFEALEQKWQWFPIATYSLFMVNLLLYYAVVVPLGAADVKNHLAFLPGTPNFWNVPLSALASIFLHENGWQLWGGGIFLCAIGAALEENLGRIRLLAFYLVFGIVAGGAGALGHQLLLGAPFHAIGSSGAIAGLLGIACVCGRRLVTFPLPFFGAIALAAPFRLAVSLNLLVLIGFFFYFNFSGGMNPDDGLRSFLSGHLLNLGGFFAGILTGALLDVQGMAREEK